MTHAGPRSQGPLRVTAMFDRIARRYDLLNRLMTLGIDVRWRRRLVRTLDTDTERRVIDVCTGTGDVALALSRRGHTVVGVDAAREMLRLAQARAGSASVSWCQGDCYALPRADGEFHAATMSFGIRNIADRVRALREIRRVVRPGGRLLVLEALPPTSRAVRWFMDVHQGTVFPLLGRFVAGDRPAYEYLGRSIAAFGTAEAFGDQLHAAGWRPSARTPMSGGSVALFEAMNPE